ncbi:MAG: hypothetical protein ABIO45_10640, partial [Burkholderiaceae bacterium]
RLDDATKKTIEHGQRIRACLKQPQFEPVAVPAQIAVLQALTAGLFDTVALPRMAEAQRAVQDAAAKLDPPLLGRLVDKEKLSDEDRKTVIESARAELKAFSPKSDAKPNGKPDAKPDAAVDAKPDEKPDAKPATAKKGAA